MTEKKSTNIAVMAIVVVLLAAGAFFYLKKSGVQVPAADPAAVEQAVDAAVQAATDQAATPPEVSATFNLDDALSDRILGDTNAPVKIVEYASLTCSHCGEFHQNTFDQVKTNYIDTGKAYLVFSDFPLNAPALHGSMLARCLPKDKFFDFVSTLFKRQEEWAFNTDYQVWLKARAVESGMSEAAFDACLANKELEEGITSRMKVVQEQSKVSSTPTFVLNDGEPMSGAFGYEAFQKSLDDALAKAANPAPEAAPAATEETTTPADESVSEDVAPETDEDAAESATTTEEPAAEEAPSEAITEE